MDASNPADAARQRIKDLLIQLGANAPGPPIPKYDLHDLSWARAELAECVKQASSSARRVAELWELLEDPVSAKDWWRRAAAMGDEDAIDYVHLIFEENVPITVRGTTYVLGSDVEPEEVGLDPGRVESIVEEVRGSREV